MRLIEDLSAITDSSIENKARILKETWANHWHTLATRQETANRLVSDINSVRDEIKQVLSSLE